MLKQKKTNKIVNKKAVAVAKDVIKRLRYLQPARGTYLSGEIFFAALPANADGALQQHLPVVERHCRVCAMGACLLSYVRLYDEVPLRNVATRELEEWSVFADSGIKYILDRVFGRDQLELIESAFECRDMRSNFWLDSYSHEATRVADAVAFGKALRRHRDGYDANRDVLREIMRNIIKNGGIFNPPERSDKT